MKFFNKIWKKIKTPKTTPLVLFYILFTLFIGGTLTLVICVPNQTIWHFILYPISAILLSYFIYTIVYLSPKIKTAIINSLNKHNFTRALLLNYGYRTIIFSIFSFIINISYVAFMGTLGIINKSVWYISLAVYYLVLSLMKGNVYHSKIKHNTPYKQARAYRYAGIMFILMTIAFSGIIVLIYTSNMMFEYAGLMIYVVATFTFYKLSLAIYNIFKARKQEDLYIQTIRNINLASALISIVVLQVAMFQSFAPEYNTSIANGLTGAGVSLIILSLGIYMIIKANIKLKKSNNMENSNDQ